MAGHNTQTLNYKIMQIVLDAARSLGKDIFTATDVVYKVHENLPNMPATTIRTYVLAMSSNPHRYFDLLGSESYRIANRNATLPEPSPPVTAPIIVQPPKPPTPAPTEGPVLEAQKPAPTPQEPAEEPQVAYLTKEGFNQKYGATITIWTKENRNNLVIGRRNYLWRQNNLTDSIDKRNALQKQLVLSRIRNLGGVDLDTLDAIMAWGFPNPLFPERDEQTCLQVTREAFVLLDQGRPGDAILKLMTLQNVGITRASKIIGLFDQNYFAILDARVGTALKTLTFNDERIIKSPPGMNRVGDHDVTPSGWANTYQKLLWVLELIRNELNDQGFPFSIADVEMALFMMGE